MRSSISSIAANDSCRAALDEAAGVDDDEIGPVGLVHQLVAVELQQAEHPLAVDEVLRAAEADEGVGALIGPGQGNGPRSRLLDDGQARRGGSVGQGGGQRQTSGRAEKGRGPGSAISPFVVYEIGEVWRVAGDVLAALREVNGLPKGPMSIYCTYIHMREPADALELAQDEAG